MGFLNQRQFVDAELYGAAVYSTWRKTPSQVTGAGIWFDLSMSPGNPVPNYYASAPLVAKALARSTDGGLNHGGNVAQGQYHLQSRNRKFMRKFTALTVTAAATPLPIILCDYLLFYPFIDEGSLDPQPLDNTVTLPRYTDGAGVQMMAVVVAGQTGSQMFRVTYTNSNGVAGRVTPDVACNTQAVNGTILTSAQARTAALPLHGPFLPLQAGDTGVRSVQEVQMLGEDVGLFTLVLLKPLAQHMIRGIDAPVETDFYWHFSGFPEIEDDAYLNMICCPNGSLTGAPIHGDLTVAWG